MWHICSWEKVLCHKLNYLKHIFILSSTKSFSSAFSIWTPSSSSAYCLCLFCVGICIAAAVFVTAVAVWYARTIVFVATTNISAAFLALALYTNIESHHSAMVDLSQPIQWKVLGCHLRYPTGTEWYRLTCQVGLAGDLQIGSQHVQEQVVWCWRQGFDFGSCFLLDEECEAGRLHGCMSPVADHAVR